ncbi:MULTISPECIES: hypothetical protein [Alphaproteobacteria]|uniref:Uncharacterized protein n=1 Tax=Pannonibacter phragmitetus TaxID=121719 RepID=A0A0U3PIE8_9HYPH|nr:MULTISPECIES: hypothetical protein [Alphaproteobacteria]ALV27404.1 hypothetical protein APZ00_10315 [Pannonibacter phragmitetus]
MKCHHITFVCFIAASAVLGATVVAEAQGVARTGTGVSISRENINRLENDYLQFSQAVTATLEAYSIRIDELREQNRQLTKQIESLHVDLRKLVKQSENLDVRVKVVEKHIKQSGGGGGGGGTSPGIDVHCPAGQALQSLSGSTPKCVNLNASLSGTCPPGHVVRGIAANGNLLCMEVRQETIERRACESKYVGTDRCGVRLPKTQHGQMARALLVGGADGTRGLATITALCSEGVFESVTEQLHHACAERGP